MKASGSSIGPVLPLGGSGGQARRAAGPEGGRVAGSTLGHVAAGEEVPDAVVHAPAEAEVAGTLLDGDVERRAAERLRSVPADVEKKWMTVPCAISSPWNSKSSSASRVTQVTVGFRRMTFDGRRGGLRPHREQVPLLGLLDERLEREAGWLRVVSTPPKMSSTTCTRSSSWVSRSLVCAWTRHRHEIVGGIGTSGRR